MLNVSNLPGQPDEPEGSPNEEPAIRQIGPAPLVPDSAAAQALYAAWSGERVVVVNAPPGSGKTELFATVVAHLSQRTDLKVVGAMPTREQVVGDANRLSTQVQPERIAVNMSGQVAGLVDGIRVESSGRNIRNSGGTWVPSGTPTRHVVDMRTIASSAMQAPTCDVMVVDEAYQATFAQVSEAARRSEQVILVGDPGQIGPVVTVDTSGWAHRPLAPHLRAPEAFAQIGAVSINLDTTWRLGKRSAAAIAPLYAFEFTSSRPDRSVDGLEEIESFVVPTPDSPYDPTLLTVVAEHAAALSEGTLTEADGSTRKLTEQDVAVVVSHNAQVSGIGGLLHSMGVYGVTVGTADRLQGGEWHAVVGVDPFIGHGQGLSPHTLSLGRLCVMASRHSTHLSWFHDGEWESAIDDATMPTGTAKRSKSVRQSLCAV